MATVKVETTKVPTPKPTGPSKPDIDKAPDPKPLGPVRKE